MKSFASIVKAVKAGSKAGSAAYKKSKADDIAAAAKKAKEAEEKAKAAKKLKAAYDTGVEEGIKKGKKKIKRKIAVLAAGAGAGYLEYKTGAISKAVKKGVEAYRTRNAKPQTHKGAPSKPSGENKPTWRSAGGAKSAAAQAAKTKSKKK